MAGCPHRPLGPRSDPCAEPAVPGHIHQGSGFSGRLSQFLQLERAEGRTVPALLALVLGHLHGVGSPEGQRDTQAGQAGAWEPGKLGVISGAPSAVQRAAGEAGSFGGLLLSCNGKTQKEDGNPGQGFVGGMEGGGRER